KEEGQPSVTRFRNHAVSMTGFADECQREIKKAKPPVTFATRVLVKAGNNLLSRYSHYHGPQVLNGRVRNGNGCGHLGMVTGKTHQGLEDRGQGLVKTQAPPIPCKYQKGSGSNCISVCAPCSALRACAEEFW